MKSSLDLIGALTSCLLAFGTLRSMAADLRVESPRDFQVCQRATRLAGPVTIRGSASAPGSVSIRITGRGLNGAYDSNWVKVESMGTNADFATTLTIPAGGWYTLAVRDAAQAEVRVDHVGVGEVFVGAGQSNSTNYGEERQKPRTGRVSTFDGTTWRVANDPQPGTFDHSGGGSFWPSFGDELVEALGVPVGVAVTGNGATSVLQWQPKGTRVGIRPTAYAFVREVGTNSWECDGALFDHLARRVAQLGPRGFRAVLWHQGESDANQPNPTPRRITGPEYAAALETLIRGQRAAAGWEIPWLVALVSYHVPDDPGSGVIRDAQISLWQRGVAFEGPDTDALQGDYRDSGGRGVHFSGKGQRAHGHLWAQRVLAHLQHQHVIQTGPGK